MMKINWVLHKSIIFYQPLQSTGIAGMNEALITELQSTDIMQ